MNKYILSWVLSLFVGVSVVAQNYNMQDGQTIHTCSGTFYDSGGANANYGNTQSFIYTICPPENAENSTIQITFTEFDLEQNADKLYVYDGDSITGSLIGEYTGTEIPLAFQASGSNESGCITFRFVSDTHNTAAGWAATISCQTPCQEMSAELVASSPTASQGVIKACVGQPISFTGGVATADVANMTYSYDWDMDDGTTNLTGETVEHTYTQPGIYRVKLRVTNSSGCFSTNNLNLHVYVAPDPNVTLNSDKTDLCYGEPYSFNIDAVYDKIKYECAPPVVDLTFLPDTNDPTLVYKSYIFVDCFAPGQVLENVNDLLSICVDMEHSYLGDLDMIIVSPSGQQVSLKNYPGGAGTFLGHPWDDGQGPGPLAPGDGLEYCFTPSATTLLVDGPTIPALNSSGNTKAPGNYKSAEPLAGLVGSQLNGVWTLRIRDHIDKDNGYIFGWSIDFSDAISPNISFQSQVTGITWEDNNDIVSTNGGQVQLLPSTSGERCYKATITNDFNCSKEVTYCFNVYDKIVVGEPTNLEDCIDATGLAEFNLDEVKPSITVDPNYDIDFYNTLEDAKADVNKLAANQELQPGSPEKTIHVRIKNKTTGCEIYKTFQLVPLNCRLNLNHLPDLTMCKETGLGDFNLEQYVPVVYNGNLGYKVVFYTTENDALLQTNPIPEAQLPNYTALTEDQEIFVRVTKIGEDDIFEVTSFRLLTFRLPTVNNLPAYSVCDDGSGMGLFHLNTIVDTSEDPNLVHLDVSYYASEALAESGLESDRLPEDYTSSAGTIYVRAENPVTGCYVVLPQELVVVPAPVANVPTPIVLCDKFNDGREVFNLVSRENEIAGNPVPAGVQVSYHETETDAALRQNLIATPDAYENIVLHNQTVYVRVGYPNSSCYKIVPLELELKPTPKIVYRTSITLCDQGNNGFEFFDLTSVSSEILNGLSPSDYTLSYHTSKENAELGTPSIGNPSSFNNLIVNQVFVRVTDNTSGCYSIATIRLDVKGVPVVPTVVPTYELCDTNHDGYETFQLDTRIPSIVGNQEGLNVTFYSNEADAENASNALPYTYQNAVLNVQTLYVRVTNSSSGCYAITTMDIRVNPNPQITVPNTPYVICNLGGTGGFGTINLNDYGNELVAGTGFTVSYYETQEQAINGIDAIANPANYNNLEASNPVIWLRIVNQTSGCFSVYPITFALVTAPNMPLTFDELTACDTLGNTQDGLGVIDLTVQEASILAANNGSLSGFTVHYYEKEADAEAGVNWIGNPSAYQNTSNPQTIWVSIENDSNPTSCRRIRSFEIQINKPTKLTNPSPISICESALPNEGHESFDLTIRELSILGNVQTYGITFEYYLSEQDRNNGVNAITNPEDYVSTSSNQIIYIKVINEHGCESFTSLQLRVVPLPEVEESPEGLEACETTYGSGQASFNLKDSEAEVGKEIPNLLFTYYKTQSGAENEEAAAQINTPEAYVSGSGFVYVRVRNAAAQSCAVIVKLPLQVHGLPKLGNLTPMLACLEGSTGFHEFNLHDKDAEVLAGQSASDYIIKYYTSENNARQDANPIPYIYTNVVQQQQDIYVRIEDKETGCYQVGHFILRVEEEVKAFEPSQELTVFCEKDFINDGSTPADLTVMDAEIMGTQVATPTAVRYYTSSGTLIADPTNYTITNGEELIAEVYVNQPGFLCTAQVLVKVSTKDGPEIADIADGVICFNYRDSNENIQVYLMDTGLPATDDYKYEWTLNGNPVGENSPTYEAKTAGTYVVKVTYLPTGCENQRTITVVEGSPIAIDEIRQSQSFEESTAIEIVATAGAGVELEYQLDGGEWQDSPIYDPLTPGEHVVKVRIKGDTVDCPAVEIIQILSHPQYFTPNGDGYNDTWNITALKGQPDARVYIFDRYGKLLKELSPSGPGWDGTLNGSPMPSSDYWFKVRYVDPQTGLEKEATGHFTLKR